MNKSNLYTQHLKKERERGDMAQIAISIHFSYYNYLYTSTIQGTYKIGIQNYISTSMSSYM